jgi:hypothetical protein
MTPHRIRSISDGDHGVKILACSCGRAERSPNEETARARWEIHAQIGRIRQSLEDNGGDAGAHRSSGDGQAIPVVDEGTTEGAGK